MSLVATKGRPSLRDSATSFSLISSWRGIWGVSEALYNNDRCRKARYTPRRILCLFVFPLTQEYGYLPLKTRAGADDPSWYLVRSSKSMRGLCSSLQGARSWRASWGSCILPRFWQGEWDGHGSDHHFPLSRWLRRAIYVSTPKIGFNAAGFGFKVKLEGAVHGAVIGEGQGIHPERFGALNKVVQFPQSSRSENSLCVCKCTKSPIISAVVIASPFLRRSNPSLRRQVKYKIFARNDRSNAVVQ